MQHLALPVAVVTEQDALCRVVGHRHIAAITHHHKTTVATEHAACRATSIEEEDSLLFHVQNAFQLALQAAADNTGIAGMKFRSEERRVGKECRSRWAQYHMIKNQV